MATDSERDGVLAASVVIPTIGRVDQLEVTLEALGSCVPRADEILVVDQSEDDRVATVVSRFVSIGAQRVASRGRGVALGSNEGVEAASNETILLTDDDCTADPGWIKYACDLVSAHPDCVFTGRVLPLGDVDAVPTTAVREVAHDYTGDVYANVLVRSNMVARRSAILEAGGFDERFITSAEDDDFGYRWLKAGGCLRYEPGLVVWHRGWRHEEAVTARYIRYGREQAWFYGKHIRTGDLRVLRFLARDLVGGLRGALGAVLRRDTRTDPRPSIARGVIVGLLGRRRD